MRIYQNRN